MDFEFESPEPNNRKDSYHKNRESVTSPRLSASLKLKGSRKGIYRRPSDANGSEINEHKSSSKKAKDKDKEEKKCCKPWTQWTMTSQICLTLLCLFAIYIPL